MKLNSKLSSRSILSIVGILVALLFVVVLVLHYQAQNALQQAHETLEPQPAAAVITTPATATTPSTPYEFKKVLPAKLGTEGLIRDQGATPTGPCNGCYPFTYYRNRTSSWQTFTSRDGWSVAVPPGWQADPLYHIADPVEPGGGAFFSSIHDDPGHVSTMESSSATVSISFYSKALNTPKENWMSQSFADNTLSTKQIVFMGYPATLKTFLALEDIQGTKRNQGEQIDFDTDSGHFVIFFSQWNNPKSGLKVADYTDFPIYQTMLSTLKISN